MRVLIVSSPGIGHVFPMVPLAWAFRAAGHDVLVATTGDALAAAQAGLHVVDLSPGFEFRTRVRELAEQDPEVFRLVRGQMHDVRLAAGMFAKAVRPLVAPLVALADEWRPDLVVHSPMDGTAPLVAARLGVPVVHHGFGFFHADHPAAVLRENLVDEYAAHDAAETPPHTIVLDVAPPSMLAENGTNWYQRYVPYNGGGVLPDWLRAPAERPRVAVTLGTVAPQLSGLAPVERVIAIAPDIDAEFVLALGDTDLDELGELPPNVRAVGWVPIHALATTCAAVVHHGGAGTTLSVLDAGVPQLVLPSGADRHINAAAVTSRGAGLSAAEEDLDVALLERLLNDEKIRSVAQEVRAEIAGMPTPATVASRLVDLVRQH